MRTFVGSALLGVSLMGGPALAEQHPWASGGHGFTGVPLDAEARAYGRATSGDRWRAGKPVTDELYGACHTGQSVFTCPGS